MTRRNEEMGDYGFEGAGEFGGTDFPETPSESCGSGCSCNAGSPKKFELYRDDAGEFRWRLRARNGRVIATSGEGYVNKADAEHGISLVKNASGVTDVQDLT